MTRPVGKVLLFRFSNAEAEAGGKGGHVVLCDAGASGAAVTGSGSGPGGRDV